MPTISAIKQQKNKNRVNVYLDDEFGFGIDLDNFVLLGLKVDQELSQEEVEKVIKKAEFQKTLDKLLRFATLRPRSEKEVKDWFKRKEVHVSIHQELFNRLNRLELIDDKKFAQWWIGQRLQFKFKSKKDITNELRIKGIKSEIIEDEVGNSEINEEKIAKALLEKKEYRWKNLEPRKARQKSMEYLLRKGFSWDIIEKTVKKA